MDPDPIHGRLDRLKSDRHRYSIIQEQSDVEGSLRQLRRQRLKEREKVVYIPLQAKAGLQASDETRFPLLEKVEEFFTSDQQVFLLLGESAAGKSTSTENSSVTCGAHTRRVVQSHFVSTCLTLTNQNKT
jgi:hypothetical protein